MLASALPRHRDALHLFATSPLVCPRHLLQEAFERCEGINGESDDMRERSAADHARHKKELAAKRQALARRVAAAAAGTAE